MRPNDNRQGGGEGRRRKGPAFSIAPIGRAAYQPNPMPVIGLDHILIAIPEGAEPQAIRFYCGLLGFSQIEKPKELAGRGGVWMRAGDFILHLGTEKDFVAPRRAHPGFLVDNLATMIETLRAENVELTFDIPLLGYDRVHIRDPFGNRIELLQRL